MDPKLSKDISLEPLVVELLVVGILFELVNESRDSSVLPVVVDPLDAPERLDIDKGLFASFVESDLFVSEQVPCPTEILFTSDVELFTSLVDVDDFPAIASNIELNVELIDFGSAS